MNFRSALETLKSIDPFAKLVLPWFSETHILGENDICQYLILPILKATRYGTHFVGVLSLVCFGLWSLSCSDSIQLPCIYLPNNVLMSYLRRNHLFQINVYVISF